MAGYYNYSMSNNAVSAYESGEMPISKWTKKEMLFAIEEISDTPDMFKKLTAAELKKNMPDAHILASYVYAF